jgi:hypothetical protein
MVIALSSFLCFHSSPASLARLSVKVSAMRKFVTHSPKDAGSAQRTTARQMAGSLRHRTARLRQQSGSGAFLQLAQSMEITCRHGGGGFDLNTTLSVAFKN